MTRQLFAAAYLLVCTLCGSNALAQYNKTYLANINGAFVNSNAIDIADAGNGEYCVLSAAGTQAAPSLVLRKHDFNGNILFETSHAIPGISPQKLLHTPNDEYIVVGLHYGAAGVTNPFAARFDNSGNFMWLYVYQCNTTFLSFPGSFCRVNVVRAEDDVNETYILVAPGQQVYSTTFNNDIVINAMKIRANGWPLWSNKYAMSPADRNGTYGAFTAIQDLPYALACGTDGNSYKYFIAGVTLKSIFSERNYHFSIDGNGAIVDPYQEYWGPAGYPFGHDAIFDATTNEFVLTHTQGNSGIVGNPNVSQIAIVKYDFNTLGINAWHYYYDANAVECYGKSIKENAAQDAYIVASWVSNPLSPNQSIVNTALLKVDKAANPIFLKRYNENVTSRAPAIISLTDPGSLTENYVMAGYVSDVRMYSTDVNGDVCGVIDVPVEASEHTEQVKDYPYADNYQDPTYTPVNLQNEGIFTNITDCINAPDPSQYKNRPTGITVNNAAGDITVFPTLLEQDNNTIILETFVEKNTTLQLQLFTIDGRMAGSVSFEVKTGSLKKSWQMPSLLPGTYILNISPADETLNKTVRITKL